MAMCISAVVGVGDPERPAGLPLIEELADEPLHRRREVGDGPRGVPDQDEVGRVLEQRLELLLGPAQGTYRVDVDTLPRRVGYRRASAAPSTTPGSKSGR